MEFVKKTFRITNKNKVEVWYGEQDRSGKYNSLAVVDVQDQDKPNELFFGQVKDDYFHGQGIKISQNNELYVGGFENGAKTTGANFSKNTIVVKNFTNNNENIFIVKENVNRILRIFCRNRVGVRWNKALRQRIGHANCFNLASLIPNRQFHTCS